MIDIKRYWALNWIIALMAPRLLLKIAITQNPLLVRRRRKESSICDISTRDWNVKWEKTFMERIDALFTRVFSFLLRVLVFTGLHEMTKLGKSLWKISFSSFAQDEEVCENLEMKPKKAVRKNDVEGVA